MRMKVRGEEIILYKRKIVFRTNVSTQRDFRIKLKILRVTFSTLEIIFCTDVGTILGRNLIEATIEGSKFILDFLISLRINR